ncbi:MAG: hypothetical protein [Bacteriophage sp.]|nr:MAG: hypothetical protein [Bacteriophage sp.]
MLQITDKGISIDDFDTIYVRLAESFKRIYGNDVNLDSDTPDGQLLALFTQEMAYVHQAVSFIVQMLDPYQATGQWLEQRALYAGLVRNTASYSYVDEVIITGAPKTNIPVSSILIDANKNKWVTVDQLMLNDLGSARAKLRSYELGNFSLKKGDDLIFSTIIIGIDRVTANNDSYGGADEESDAKFLKRFMLSHSINNYDEKKGVQAALMSVVGVKKCVVYENYTSQTDEKNVPPHSFNAVVLGGSDEDIAQVITKKKIGGCGLFGQVEASCNLREHDRKVRFDRPRKIDVSVIMTIARYKSFNDINTDEIIDNLKALAFDIGENVYASRIISSINLTDGFYIKDLSVNGSSIAKISHREYAEIINVEVLIDE